MSDMDRNDVRNLLKELHAINRNMDTMNHRLKEIEQALVFKRDKLGDQGPLQVDMVPLVPNVTDGDTISSTNRNLFYDHFDIKDDLITGKYPPFTDDLK